jgi:hypothetical protein
MASGFGVGLATVKKYVSELVETLAVTTKDVTAFIAMLNANSINDDLLFFCSTKSQPSHSLRSAAQTLINLMSRKLVLEVFNSSKQIDPVPQLNEVTPSSVAFVAAEINDGKRETILLSEVNKWWRWRAWPEALFRNKKEISLFRYSPKKLRSLLMSLGVYDLFIQYQKKILLVVRSALLAFSKYILDLDGGSAVHEVLANALTTNWDEGMLWFKSLSDKYKAGWPVDRHYAEITSLNGYLTLPDPAWDPVKETEILAHSGTKKHGFVPGFEGHFSAALRHILRPEQFKRVSNRVVHGTHQSKKIITSEYDYYISERWVATGSSSEGRVSFQFQDEDFDIKARKNMVLDSSVAQNWMSFFSSVPQIGVTFTKEEWGRFRLVVGSDLGTNIKLKYFSQVLEFIIERVTGLSFRDSKSYFLDRLEKLKSAFSSQLIACSFDYKGFERQPTLPEIKIIFTVLIDVVTTLFPEMKTVGSVIIAGLDEQVLSNDGQDFDVTGGLPSGIAWTTFVGGLWNIAGFLAALTVAGIKWQGFDVNKGDDKVFVGSNGLLTMISLSSMLAAGFESGAGKLNVLGLDTASKCVLPNLQRAEFLRIEYSQSGARGFTNREISSFFQRKPWAVDSSLVWANDIGKIGNVAMVERRSLLKGKTPMYEVFSRNVSAWTFVPVKYGGGGMVLPSSMKFRMPDTAILGLLRSLKSGTSVNLVPTPERVANILSNYRDLYPIENIDTASLAGTMLSQKLVISDVPQYKTRARKRILDAITPFSLWPIPSPDLVFSDIPSIRLDHDFGKWSNRQGRIEKWLLANKHAHTPLNFRAWLQANFPMVLSSLRSVENRYKMSRGDSLDYIFGKISYLPLPIVHPLQISEVHAAFANFMWLNKSSFKNYKDRTRYAVANRFCWRYSILLRDLEMSSAYNW